MPLYSVPPGLKKLIRKGNKTSEEDRKPEIRNLSLAYKCRMLMLQTAYPCLSLKYKMP
jgi:hypothetical protein